MRTWLKWACAAATLTAASSAMAADHLDGPGVKADPTTDINDVYAFIDGERIVLAMTVFPAADATAAFSDVVQYVFNIETTAVFGVPGDTSKIVCSFSADATQVASCYVGTPGSPAVDWVMGEAGTDTGVTSDSGKLQVFAGMRADPFFFNLEGFTDTVSTVIDAAPGLTFDEANCPNVDQATSAVLVNQLQSTEMGTMPAEDFFLTLNTMAIVVSLDRSLFNADHNLLNVWASTHRMAQ